MSDIIMQQLKAPNDANGNPRRLYVFYGRGTGTLIGIHDEGYAGKPRAKAGIDILELDGFEIIAAKYRELKRRIPELLVSCMLYENFIKEY